MPKSAPNPKSKSKKRDRWTIEPNFVPGEGDLPTRLMFVGEAPGKWESRNLRPWVGKAGKLLRSVLLRLGLSDYYLTNAFKNRPTDGADKDRPPTAAELESQRDVLEEEIAGVKRGGVIVCLGASAAKAILGRDVAMESVHGLPVTWNGRTVIVAFHPAAGLRKPQWMVAFYHDMIAVKNAVEGRAASAPPAKVDWKFGLDRRIVADSRLMGLDTEGDGTKLFCASASTRPWDATVVRADSDSMTGLELQIEGCNKIVGHYWLGVDLGNLESVGIKIRDEQIVDTFVMAHCLQSEPLGLKDLARRHFGEDLVDYKDFVKPWHRKALLDTIQRHCFPEDLDKVTSRVVADLEADRTVKPERIERVLGHVPEYGLEVVPESEWVPYAAKDTICLPLYHVLAPKVAAMSLEDVVEVDTACIPSFYAMQRHGLPIDKTRVAALEADLEKESDSLLSKFRSLARVPPTFNVGSPEQVEELLFNKLRLKPLHKTDSGERWSTDAKTLESLQGQHPAVDTLLAWRKVQKIRTAFLPAVVEAGDRLYFSFGIPTVTGRPTSELILMMPRRGPLGKRLRSAFVAPPGKVFVSIDFSQIEIRVMADESQDPKMLELIRAGHDFHAATAHYVLKNDNRDDGKILNFAIQYEATEYGIYKQARSKGLDWTIEDCADFRAGWMKTYAGVARRAKERHQEARRYGYVRDRWGRIRYCPSVWADDSILRGEGEREASNFPIQAGANGEVKRAQLRVWKEGLPELRRAGVEIELLLQIHDDLLFLVDEDAVNAGIVVEYLSEIMVEGARDRYSVPIEVDAKVGKSWGELEGVKKS